MMKIVARIATAFTILCSQAANAQFTIAQLQTDVVASWLVKVEGENRTRTLRIKGIGQNTANTFPLDADYGWSDGWRSQVKAEISQNEHERKLILTTQADSKIVATQTPNGGFTGTFTLKNGTTKGISLEKISENELRSRAQANPTSVHFIWMGGNDCPPCVEWRRTELPKLQQSPEFNAVTFSYVTKSIKSPVPSSFFLPAEVKPYRDKLDIASSGQSGSPQGAFIVNGEVFHYFVGTLSASTIENMLIAIRIGGPYPFKRCLKISTQWGKCEVSD